MHFGLSWWTLLTAPKTTLLRLGVQERAALIGHSVPLREPWPRSVGLWGTTPRSEIAERLAVPLSAVHHFAWRHSLTAREDMTRPDLALLAHQNYVSLGFRDAAALATGILPVEAAIYLRALELVEERTGCSTERLGSMRQADRAAVWTLAEVDAFLEEIPA